MKKFDKAKETRISAPIISLSRQEGFLELRSDIVAINSFLSFRSWVTFSKDDSSIDFSCSIFLSFIRISTFTFFACSSFSLSQVWIISLNNVAISGPYNLLSAKVAVLLLPSILFDAVYSFASKEALLSRCYVYSVFMCIFLQANLIRIFFFDQKLIMSEL